VIGAKYNRLRLKPEISCARAMRRVRKRFGLDEEVKVLSCYEPGRDGFRSSFFKPREAPFSFRLEFYIFL
jgi:hypothetical protein